MKKLDLIVVLFVVLSIVVGGVVLAASPWLAKIEGNGILRGDYLLSEYGVIETDIGWNFKVKAADDTVVGNLNIVEKLVGEGPPNHFQLTGADVKTFFAKCGTDELRVEGTNEAGQTVAAHFRGVGNSSKPKTVWYWVKRDGSFITNCGTQLALDGDDFTIECNP